MTAELVRWIPSYLHTLRCKDCAAACCCAGVPVGLLLYGWAARLHAHLAWVSNVFMSHSRSCAMVPHAQAWRAGSTLHNFDTAGTSSACFRSQPSLVVVAMRSDAAQLLQSHQSERSPAATTSSCSTAGKQVYVCLSCCRHAAVVMFRS